MSIQMIQYMLKGQVTTGSVQSALNQFFHSITMMKTMILKLQSLVVQQILKGLTNQYFLTCSSTL